MATSDIRYYRISPRFWQDLDVRRWTEDMRMLALYLVTSPHRNMVGLFYCPLAYIENDLQWNANRTRVAFDRLASAGFVQYDPEAQVLLICNSLKYDAPNTDMQVVGAIRLLNNLPPTALLLALLEAADKHCSKLASAIRVEFECHLNDIRVLDPGSRYPVPGSRYPHTGDRIPQPVPSECHSPLAPSADADPPVVTPAQVVAWWNEERGDVLPECSKLTDKRRKHLKARLAHKGRDEAWWRGYFARIRASPFCCGENDRGWKAGIDFAIRSEDVVASVLEGKYDPRAPNSGPVLSDNTRRALELVKKYEREEAAARDPT